MIKIVFSKFTVYCQDLIIPNAARFEGSTTLAKLRLPKIEFKDDPQLRELFFPTSGSRRAAGTVHVKQAVANMTCPVRHDSDVAWRICDHFAVVATPDQGRNC